MTHVLWGHNNDIRKQEEVSDAEEMWWHLKEAVIVIDSRREVYGSGKVGRKNPEIKKCNGNERGCWERCVGSKQKDWKI